MIRSIKSLSMSKSFWKIQLLNVLWVGRYYFLTCCKVISNLVLISLIFEGLVVASDQKELFLKMNLNLFYLLFIFRMMYLGMKFGIKSNADSLNLFLKEVRILVAMAIFLRFGGLNVETYDSILQGFTQNNFDYLLDNYDQYFEKDGMMQVQFRLAYSWIIINKFCVIGVIEHCEQETEKLKPPLMV